MIAGPAQAPEAPPAMTILPEAETKEAPPKPAVERKPAEAAIWQSPAQPTTEETFTDSDVEEGEAEARPWMASDQRPRKRLRKERREVMGLPRRRWFLLWLR
jgi:hypothetical protein